MQTLAVNLNTLQIISHLLERSERGEYGASYPGSVSPLLGSVGRDQFEPHGGGSLDAEISVETLVKAVEAGVATRHHDVPVERRSEVDVAHPDTGGHHVSSSWQ